jgi:hypothetical protein
MPDPLQILEAMALAGGAGALVLLLLRWTWRSPHPARAAIGEVVGIGAGFALGCWWLGVRPHWPPREDLDRLLILVLPAAGAAEIVTVLLRRPTWIGWVFRLIVAAGAAPVLLYGSIYLADAAGPGTRQWTPAQAVVILLALAGALAANWALLGLLVRRTASRSVTVGVAVGCGGAAVTVMLSGYATGGEIGLPLAAALAGAMVASLGLGRGTNAIAALSVGIVGLFGLVVMGRFFGELHLNLAYLVFFAPLLAWLPELPYAHRLNGTVRAFARVVLTVVPVAVALALAVRDFAHETTQGSPSSGEPSIQDYMDYGK